MDFLVFIAKSELCTELVLLTEEAVSETLSHCQRHTIDGETQAALSDLLPCSPGIGECLAGNTRRLPATGGLSGLRLHCVGTTGDGRPGTGLTRCRD